MKNLKSLFFLSIFALSVAMFSCSKSGDPTPTTAQKTALDSVKAALTGKWTFSSVSVHQVSTNKSATTSSCGKSELTSAGFSNQNWKNFTPEPTFTYAGSNSAVTINYPCLTNNPSDAASFVITQVSAKVFNVQFNDIATSNLMTFQINSADTKTSTIKATLSSTGTVSMNDYTATYLFTKN